MILAYANAMEYWILIYTCAMIYGLIFSFLYVYNTPIKKQKSYIQFSGYSLWIIMSIVMVIQLLGG